MADLETTEMGFYVNTTTLPPDEPSRMDEQGWVPVDTFIGIVLAFSSCFLIGTSVIYKKLALQDIEASGATRAVDGGYGYLRIPKWWLGITLMALGELTNFVAYIFAPAILVTPLGVFSIVCTAALSPYFLKERLALLGKLGCILVLVGCAIVTLCGPKDREISSMDELQAQLLHPGFLIYASLVVTVSCVLMALVPRYGHRYVMLYITICSSFGSLSVMFCKGVGLALKQTFSSINAFTNWATWVCLVALIACLLIETVYMQRALDIFNSSVFMSVNYVLFTSLVIVASSILYTELRELGWKNILLTILGFVVNIVALYLLHLDKEGNTDPDMNVGENDEKSNIEDEETASIKGVSVGKSLAAVQPNQVEQQTPLLTPKAPASPLAGLQLPSSMFRESKSNSCMSLISEAGSHTGVGEDHEKVEVPTYRPHYTRQDSNRGSTGRASTRSVASSISGDVSNKGSIGSGTKGAISCNNNNINNNNMNKRGGSGRQCNSHASHHRTPSGCLCEIPLITELQSSSTKLNSTSNNNNNNNNNSSSKNSNSSFSDVTVSLGDGTAESFDDKSVV
ncbi:uncharacterized protein LOC143029300 [Oratosquilla oratoria]|uniref:uncharacterized protein LOC143029300 n=1 Tax=Oratosquilla oratoria TaxID=337810 RepID=UPI003F7707E9